jgi:hypothetical protein
MSLNENENALPNDDNDPWKPDPDDLVTLLAIAANRFMANPAHAWRKHPRTLTVALFGGFSVALFSLIGFTSVVGSLLPHDDPYRIRPTVAAVRPLPIPDTMVTPFHDPPKPAPSIREQIALLQYRVNALEQKQQPEPASAPAATP